MREIVCNFQSYVEESMTYYVYTFSQLLMGETREGEEQSDKAFTAFPCCEYTKQNNNTSADAIMSIKSHHVGQKWSEIQEQSTFAKEDTIP